MKLREYHEDRLERDHAYAIEVCHALECELLAWEFISDAALRSRRSPPVLREIVDMLERQAKGIATWIELQRLVDEVGATR